MFTFNVNFFKVSFFLLIYFCKLCRYTCDITLTGVNLFPIDSNEIDDQSFLEKELVRAINKVKLFISTASILKMLT